MSMGAIKMVSILELLLRAGVEKRRLCHAVQPSSGGMKHAHDLLKPNIAFRRCQRRDRSHVYDEGSEPQSTGEHENLFENVALVF